MEKKYTVIDIVEDVFFEYMTEEEIKDFLWGAWVDHQREDNPLTLDMIEAADLQELNSYLEGIGYCMEEI